MHVFCPDCNAEYKVTERSSLTKTIKFVCIECEGSWVDKFEKLERKKIIVAESQKFTGDVVIENENKEIDTIELNSLALEEVKYSFGSKKNSTELKELLWQTIKNLNIKLIILECTNLSPYKNIFRDIFRGEIVDLLVLIDKKIPGIIKQEYL